MWRKDLQRDPPVQSGVGGGEDLAHSSAADAAGDPIMSDCLGDRFDWLLRFDASLSIGFIPIFANESEHASPKENLCPEAGDVLGEP